MTHSEIITIDLETSGLDPESSVILEIAIVSVKESCLTNLNHIYNLLSSLKTRTPSLKVLNPHLDPLGLRILMCNTLNHATDVEIEKTRLFHKLTKSDISKGLSMSEFKNEIEIAITEKTEIVSHNCDFERKFLGHLYRDNIKMKEKILSSIVWKDTLLLSKNQFKKKSHSLQNMAKELLDLDDFQKYYEQLGHSALFDAITCGALYWKILQES